ncbi:DUF4148 domain-containing protein [Bordetella genomosp. 13]|uniref:DUF4148 domain-containing protein n=1 Tax=Bordetella genomosp. 13 TaxID=463040 RepID=UPI0021B64390|nr:DUF4148 domain-containing protein [Bordetella genomosp. 13]
MKTLTAALMMTAGLMSASAFAGSNIEPNDVPFQGVYGDQHDAGSLSRAQVEADLAQARANGLVANVEPNDVPFQAAAYGASAQASRADVQAQAAAARTAGLSSNVEPNDTPFVAQNTTAQYDAVAAE